jgi:galactose oxidase-like protein/Big-like domain-containing protein
VQSAYNDPQPSAASVPVAYSGTQTAGNLNVVAVGWNDTTAQVNSVKDTAGNVYQLAVGPTKLNAAGGFTQSMYYAKNIVASSGNTVTVTFSQAALYPDVRILEYSGVNSTNPVDVVTAQTQNASATSTAGVLATTNSVDLLVAANSVQSLTIASDPTFTERVHSSPDGEIAEDRVVTAPGLYSASASLNGVGAWVMQMVAFRGASNPPADTTPPSVNITAPTGGTLSGTTTVTVNASDSGTGVAGVQLQIDGLVFGTAAAASPYTFTLKTTKFANGTHTISATARDFANNTANANPVSVTFSNGSPGNPGQFGVWSPLVPLPIISVHSDLMPNGKILMWDGQPNFGPTAIVWDPIYNTVNWTSAPVDTFCTSVEALADGRPFLAGGTDQISSYGLKSTLAFNPNTESWTTLADMAYARWYPTTTILPDGRIIVSSGEVNGVGTDEPIHEIYNLSTNSWTQLSSAPWKFPYYPHLYVLSDGRVLAAATAEAAIVSQILDLNSLTWTPVGGSAVDGGTSAMYLPNKIVKMGKSWDPDNGSTPSVATTYVLDMTQATPTWRQTASMAFARTYATATSLPDGTVLVTGGGTTTGPKDVANAVLPAELWSPTSESWTTLAAMNSPRLYHSEAVLLADGRLFIYGGGRFDNSTVSTDQFSGEFFSPPYLFKGSRPVITSAPSQLSYGQNFTVQTPDAGRIAKVSLIRFGGVTHAQNWSQRFLPLTFSAGSGSLSVTAPVNASLAPPGYYMLFLVDTNGVPSIAATVHF